MRTGQILVFQLLNGPRRGLKSMVWRQTSQVDSQKRKSPSGRPKQCLALGPSFGTTPAATRALRRPPFRLDLGLTFETPKALISGHLVCVPKLTLCETLDSSA